MIEEIEIKVTTHNISFAWQESILSQLSYRKLSKESQKIEADLVKEFYYSNY